MKSYQKLEFLLNIVPIVWNFMCHCETGSFCPDFLMIIESQLEDILY